MKRARIVLLVACTVLAVGSVAGGLVQAASRAAYERFGAPESAATLTPSFFAYLPLVFRSWSPGPAWVTVVDEGFESESPPSEPWKFCDANQPQQDLYCWGPRSCPGRAATGNFSAWAVGGGTLGTNLPCGSGYPGNVDSRMEYGPFDLRDATSAYLRFSFWLDRGEAYDIDKFCWSAWSNSTDRQEVCLTFDTGTWWSWTEHLDDPKAISMLGKPQVWIGFRFTSSGSGSQAEGAYVDDILIRKCVGGTCPAVSGSAPVPADGLGGRSPAPLSAARPSQLHSSGR